MRINENYLFTDFFCCAVLISKRKVCVDHLQYNELIVSDMLVWNEKINLNKIDCFDMLNLTKIIRLKISIIHKMYPQQAVETVFQFLKFLPQ